jgi:hypothetical protein
MDVTSTSLKPGSASKAGFEPTAIPTNGCVVQALWLVFTPCLIPRCTLALVCGQ